MVKEAGYESSEATSCGKKEICLWIQTYAMIIQRGNSKKLEIHRKNRWNTHSYFQTEKRKKKKDTYIKTKQQLSLKVSVNSLKVPVPTFGSSSPALGIPLAPSTTASSVTGVPQNLHGRVEVVLPELALMGERNTWSGVGRWIEPR